MKRNFVIKEPDPSLRFGMTVKKEKLMAAQVHKRAIPLLAGQAPIMLSYALQPG